MRWPMRPSVTAPFKALSHECHIGQRMRNEWRLTHEKRMTLTKEKNNMQTQRKLPNDGRPVTGSNGHVTQFDRYQRMPKK